MKVAYAILFLAIVSFVARPTTLQAQDDHAVVMHFDKAIEVPGQVLPAGTYRFVVPMDMGGNVVQIYNASHTRLITTVKAIPATRLDPADKILVTLGEGHRVGTPALVRWFTDGSTSGYELLYPHHEEQQLRAHEKTETVGPLEGPVSGD